MDSKVETVTAGKPAGRKPPNAGKGRPKGSKNLVTKSIKEAIEAAFDQVGGAAYLAKQAEGNPTAFMGLIGKIIPQQVQAAVSGSLELKRIERVIVDHAKN